MIRETPMALAFVVIAGLGVTPGAIAQEEAPDEPRTVIVKMLDFEYEPATVTVQYGDVVRFVQETSTPHNVEFRQYPEGSALARASRSSLRLASTRATDPPTPRMGPFLVAKGQTYEIVIDAQFARGVHKYVCTPHETLGMKGTILIEGDGPDAGSSKDR